MEYMLIHTVDPELAPVTAAEEREAWDIFTAWSAELDVAPTATNLHGSRLRPPGDATTISTRDGKVLITDGPYAETKEQIGGYDVIECDTIDTALGWAGKHPHARMGSVEVRPLRNSSSNTMPRVPLPDPEEGTARYMLLMWADRSKDPAAIDKIMQSSLRAGDELHGSRVFSGELDVSRAARTVRVRDTNVTVTDGPFCETDGQLAGFDLIDAADLDAVIKVAVNHPSAHQGAIEVRPLWLD